MTCTCPKPLGTVSPLCAEHGSRQVLRDGLVSAQARLHDLGKKNVELQTQLDMQTAEAADCVERVLELERAVLEMTPRVRSGDGLRDEMEAAFRVMDPDEPCSVSLATRCGQLVDRNKELEHALGVHEGSYLRQLDEIAALRAWIKDDRGVEDPDLTRYLK